MEKDTLKRKRALSNPIVIMAGGKGSRLEPFTQVFPKALIPIDEKPVMEIIMKRFYNFGFRHFIFTLNYKKEYIKMFLRKGNLPYRIDWVEENEYTGTAGSLSLLKNKIDKTFIVSNCDTIVSANYTNIIRTHKKDKNLMTIIGCYKKVEIPYGILESEKDRLTRFIEKPTYDMLINTGVYVVEPEVISLIPKDRRLDMNVLIKLTADKGRVAVYPIRRGWIDVGQWGGYRESFNELKKI